MRITTTETTVSVTRHVALTDAPIVTPEGYRRSLQPDKLLITYVWRDGRYVTDRYGIVMAGPWIKKDHTPAADRAGSIHPETQKFPSTDWAEQWAWLQPIIDLLRPDGDLSMTIANDHEVG
jgi:hypothetical protein